MPRVEVDSSAVAAVAYSARQRSLDVEFRSGGRYRYHGVPPAVYELLLRADSVGAFVNLQVKPRYRFTRLRPGRARPASGTSARDRPV